MTRDTLQAILDAYSPETYSVDPEEADAVWYTVRSEGDKVFNVHYDEDFSEVLQKLRRQTEAEFYRRGELEAQRRMREALGVQS